MHLSVSSYTGGSSAGFRRHATDCGTFWYCKLVKNASFILIGWAHVVFFKGTVTLKMLTLKISTDSFVRVTDQNSSCYSMKIFLFANWACHNEKAGLTSNTFGSCASYMQQVWICANANILLRAIKVKIKRFVMIWGRKIMTMLISLFLKTRYLAPAYLYNCQIVDLYWNELFRWPLRVYVGGSWPE